MATKVEPFARLCITDVTTVGNQVTGTETVLTFPAGTVRGINVGVKTGGEGGDVTLNSALQTDAMRGRGTTRGREERLPAPSL
ncbi:hypothetical protein VZT92_026702 [Zoarces viviparus]|uniref:Uncharacterized protein n=1 Tax=Zoarces viviparus TaxID=48416 RepID=A0AAW1DSE0_ZOAVI